MHHYTKSGLRNVWLTNGYAEHKTAYGVGVSIEDVGGLHCLLAKKLADKQGRLTAAELRFLRTHLQLSQANLAKPLGVTEENVSLWERRGNVPKTADMWVRALVLAKLDGDSKVSDLLDRINTVDRMVNQRIFASEKRHKWHATVTADEEAAEAM